MKKTNKKGFTIVELVIVIAVIAVLAAVLIPTFSGIIKKARLSSDKQAVNQMSEQVAIALAEKDIASLDELVDVLAAAGYNAEDSLVPVSTNHGFFWSWDEKVLFLAKVDENDLNKPLEVVFPEDSENLIASGARYDSLRGTYKYVDIVATDNATLEQALMMGNEKIKLENDMVIKSETMVTGANVTLDLNGKTLTSEETTGRHKYLNVDAGATLTITNGTAALRGVGVYGKVVVGEGATVQSIDDNGGACLWVYEGGEVVIDGGIFTATGGDFAANNDHVLEPGVISNNGGTVTINDGTFEALESGCYAINNNAGTLVINGGTFKAMRGVIGASAGNVTINGGDFATTGASGIAANVVWSKDAIVTVNGGNFTNVAGHKFAVGDQGAGAGSITIKAGVAGVAADTVVTLGQSYD